MAKGRSRRQTSKEGDILAIPLGDGTFAFGQVCRGLDHAYFDLRSSTMPPLEAIVAHPAMFRVPVALDAIRVGGWKVLGNLPLAGSLAQFQAYRNQPVCSNQLYIYRADQPLPLPATLDEARDLEAFAIWFPMHIVERLQDHFAGRPNRTFEFLKRIKKYDPQTGEEIGTV